MYKALDAFSQLWSIFTIKAIAKSSYLGAKNRILLLPDATGRFGEPLNSSRYSSGSSSRKAAASSRVFSCTKAKRLN